MDLTLFNGRYEILRPLGAGASAEVHLARDRYHQNRPVALKRLAADEKSRTAAADEFRLLTGLIHPNLAAVYDFGVVDKPPLVFVAREYCPGQTLAESDSTTIGERLDSIVTQLVDTLAFLHLRGVAHGDLKPENLILYSNGLLKLLDFGQAFIQSSETTGGTPIYLPPEAFEGAEPCPAWDLYALGVLLAQFDGGRAPFDGDLQQLLEQKKSPQVADSGSTIARVARRLIEPNPERRLVEISELRDELGIDKPPPAAALARTRAPIGRDELQSALEFSPREERGPGCLRGKPGIGKSRLLESTRISALLAGFQVVEIAFEGLADDPLRPYRDVLQQLLEGYPDFDETEIAALLQPELISESGTGRSSSDVASQRQRRIHGLVEALLTLIGRNPTLILIDDLDRADRLSLELTGVLVRRIANWDNNQDSPAPGLIASAPEDAGFWAGISDWPLQVLDVPNLPPGSVAEWTGEVLGIAAVPERLRDAVHQLSEGHPARIEEILREVVQQGLLNPFADPDSRLSAARAIEPETLPVPGSTLSIWQRRFDSLPRSAHLAATLLALAGCALPPELLTRAAGDADWSALEQLELARAESGERRWIRLKNQMLRSLIERGSDPAQRVEYSKLLLEAAGHDPLLARRIGPEQMAALHNLLGQHEQEAQQLLLAAQHHERLTSVARAYELYQRAIELVPSLLSPQFDALSRTARQLGDFDGLKGICRALATELKLPRRIDSAVPQSEPERRATLKLRAAQLESELAAGEFKRVLKIAAKLAHQPRRDEGLPFFRLAIFACNQLGEFARARRLAETALEAGADPEISNLLGAAAWANGDLELAQQAWELARDGHRATNNQHQLTRSLYNLAILYYQTCRFTQCHRVLTEASAMADRGPFPRYQILTRNLDGIVAQTRLAEYGRAINSYRGALTTARSLNDPRLVVETLRNLAHIHLIIGRFELAAEELQTATTLARAAKSDKLLGTLATISAALELSSEQHDTALSRLKEAEQLHQATGDRNELAAVAALWVRWHRLADDPEGGFSRAEKALALAQELSALDAEVEARLNFGALLLKQGKLTHAETILRPLESQLDELSGQEYGWEIAYGLAQLEQQNDRPQQAARWRELALGVLQRLSSSLPENLRDTYRYRAPARRDAWADLEASSAVEQDQMYAIGADALTRLLAISRQLNSETELTTLLERIMDQIVALVEAERGFLLLERDGKLEVGVARGMSEGDLKLDGNAVSRSIAEEVAKSGKPIITVNAQDDERFDTTRSVHALKLRSVLAFPLRVKGRVIGTLYLDNRARSGAFSPALLPLVGAFGDQAGIAINNAETLSRLRDAEQQLRGENEYLRRQIDDEFDIEGITGSSPRLQEVLHVVRRVAPVETTILIRGESGTGKELIARAIHRLSLRSKQPLVKINCAALTPTLLESELFGHEKGAFTGADRRKPGLFSVANHGTIFLDEIGDIPMSTQVKLLRVLQEKEIMPVGGSRAQKLDVRVLAATNRNLEKMVADGSYREDLYYRLNVIPIVVPPLRQRPEDIEPLVRRFVQRFNRQLNRQIAAVDTEAMQLLRNYHWPGNVRELEHVIERAMVLAEGRRLTKLDLPLEVTGSSSAGLSEAYVVPGPLKQRLAEFKRLLVDATLKQCAGNKVKAARLLQIERRYLYTLIEKLDIGSD